jgi:hypothetical protein
MTADSNYKELRKKLKALEKEAAAILEFGSGVPVASFLCRRCE